MDYEFTRSTDVHYRKVFTSIFVTLYLIWIRDTYGRKHDYYHIAVHDHDIDDIILCIYSRHIESKSIGYKWQ